MADPLEDVQRTAAEAARRGIVDEATARVAMGFDVPAGLLGSEVPKVEIEGTWAHDPSASIGTRSGGGALDLPAGSTAESAVDEGIERFRRSVEVSGRRAGKTAAAERLAALWAMTDGVSEVVDRVAGVKLSGSRVWVCPVCYAGDTGWQVEVWNGLFPSLLDKELRAVAMNHLLDEWETHSEWCLDYLEMVQQETVNKFAAVPTDGEMETDD